MLCSKRTKHLKARGLLPKEGNRTRAILEVCFGSSGASAAEIVLVKLEDLWLETKPQNVPGVPWHSWRRKFRYTLEQVRSDADVVRILDEMNVIRREVDGNQRQEAGSSGSRSAGRAEEERAARDGR